MNNKLKMAIKSVPFVSGIAKGVNRTVGITVRTAMHYPAMRKLNNELVDSMARLDKTSGMRIWYFGVPTHPNLGDQAQKFVLKNGSKIIIRKLKLLKFQVRHLTPVPAGLSA